MLKRSKWNTWRCTHACTAFLRIDASEVEHLIPAPLVLDRDEAGRATIEIGYVRFRLRTDLSIPPTEELAWAIGVKRVKGCSSLAFYAMNLCADNQAFLQHNATIGFTVHQPPVRFQVDLDQRSFRVEDADGVICVLRHQPAGSIPLPFFPGTTEVWTGSAGNLTRRLFKWQGVAEAHLAPAVATTLREHPFFRGVRVSRAEPVPHRVFSSQRVARRAAQRFTDGVSYP